MRGAFRQLQPWPADYTTRTWKLSGLSSSTLPARPVVIAYNSTGAMCAEARFAVGEVEGRVGMSPAT
jgi:hypothetical protein